MIATFKKAETATKLSLILTILFNSVSSEKIHKVKCYLLNSMYTYMTYHDIQKQKTKNVAWIMAVLQIAVSIGGYWWLLNYRGRGWGLFFEKLEKKQEKLEKKAKLPARGIEPRISVWKAGLLTIRPRNFLL